MAKAPSQDDSRPNHRFVRLRVVSYSGDCQLFAYCNSQEFLALRLDDAIIPDKAFSTSAVEDWVNQQVADHQADAWIGKFLVHDGAAAALDNAINSACQAWWDGIKAKVGNAHYRDYAVYLDAAVSGKNDIEVSIVAHQPEAKCIVSLEFAPPSGQVLGLHTVQLDANRLGFGEALRLS